MSPGLVFPECYPSMPLLLVCLAFHHLVYPGLAAGDVEIFVVGEALFAHRHTLAAGPGGMAYLVVCRQTVHRSAAQGVGDHGQVVGFVVQPFPRQTAVTLILPGVLIPGFLLCQHAGLRVAELLVKPGVALAGTFLAA